MAVISNVGSVVAGAGQSINLSSLFSVTAGSNPQYLVLTGLDRDEYTAASNGQTGTISGNGHSLGFSSLEDDASTFGIVFSYNTGTGQYVNATYGNLTSLVLTASTDTNRNEVLSLFGSSSASTLNAYANDSYSLSQIANVSFLGSMDVVTQPGFAGPAPAQATPNSICSTALSFVGKAWNDNGCWVLASNISAEAGASLPVSSTMLGVPGVASGEWFVAYNGPAGQTGDWQSTVKAGEMVVFETSGTSGHITTVVSGSGSSAKLIDNIEYVNADGSTANAANDGSADDIIIASPHAASEEFSGAVAGSVVIYELDTPTVAAGTTAASVGAGQTIALSTLFSAADPAGKAVTQYQIYDSAAQNSFLINGVASAAHSAASAILTSASALANAVLQAGGTMLTDVLEVRASNGSYWGDWQAVTVNVTAASTPTPAPAPVPSPIAPPVVAAQTGTQTWKRGQTISFKLPAGTFIDPQGQTLAYKATQANGSALPTWLSFNAATGTFSGVVPKTAANFSVTVVATDKSGLSAAETFSVLTPAPAAPTVTAQTANQTWTQGQSISLALPANTFTDPQGEAMTYAATQVGGASVSSWLRYNAATNTFTGTVPKTSKGSFQFRVTATDAGGASASETFTVVTQAPAPPVLTARTANQTWTQGQAINLTLPANTFTDPQGQSMTYALAQTGGTSAVSSWLRFNGATDTITGTVPTSAKGAYQFRLTATDTSGASASETFSVTIAAQAAHLAHAISALAPSAAMASLASQAAQSSQHPLASPMA